METPSILNTYHVPHVLSSNKNLKKKRCVPCHQKKVNNLIIEARIMHLKQSENNKMFSNLRSLPNTANKLQNKAPRREGRLHYRCCGRQMDKLNLEPKLEWKRCAYRHNLLTPCWWSSGCLSWSRSLSFLNQFILIRRSETASTWNVPQV